jgi:outer membrane protein W
MLRKGLVLAALGVVMLLPAAAKADPPAQPFEVTLGLGASHGADLNGFNASGNLSIGYFFTPDLELSVRQSMQYTDTGTTAGGGSAWDGSTRLAVDYHFTFGDRGQVRPFIGANIGYVYGETINDTFEAAPEAGVKVMVGSSAFIYIMVEYQFFFDKGDTSEAFSDGQFLYSAGVGFRF